MERYVWAANAVVASHFALTLFVIAGPILVFIGRDRGWKWTLNFWLRFVHILFIAIVVAEAWLGTACPLTVLELWLRKKGGQEVPNREFISHWTEQLFGFPSPPWVLTVVYTLFYGVVVWTWWKVPPREETM